MTRSGVILFLRLFLVVVVRLQTHRRRDGRRPCVMAHDTPSLLVALR